MGWSFLSSGEIEIIFIIVIKVYAFNKKYRLFLMCARNGRNLVGESQTRKTSVSTVRCKLKEVDGKALARGGLIVKIT